MRTFSIALLAALLSTNAAFAQSTARNLLPMGGDMGYGSTEVREPVTTGSVPQRDPATVDSRVGRDGLRLSAKPRTQPRGRRGHVGF